MPNLSSDPSDPPRISAQFDVDLTNIPDSIFATPFMLFGGTDQNWAGFTLPLDLSFAGAPGCSIFVSVANAVQLDNNGGAARWSAFIPLDPSLIGQSYFIQGMVTDPLANAFGAVFSNAAELVIGDVLVLEVVEDFSTTMKFDSGVSSAEWGGGSLLPGTVGGSGVMGSFDVTVLPQNGAGEYVWDTDSTVVIPAASTLFGYDPIAVDDGQGEFTDFRLEAGQVLRFVGSKAPVLRVSGDVEIAGEVLLDGRAGGAPASSLDFGTRGPGGAGGGHGGRGAEPWTPPPTIAPPTPHPVPGLIHRGEDGATLMPPAGSGYSGLVGGTGGEGLGTWPESGRVVPDPSDPSVDFVNSIVSGLFSSQQISGGGGGGYLSAGAPGTIDILLRLPSDPTDDTAPPAQGGVAVPFTPAAASVDAIDHFTIGGSGGGGGGSVSTLVRPTIFVAAFLRFTNGFGGGGGGGAIGYRVGGDMTIEPTGLLSLRGGSTQSSLGNVWQSRGTSVSGGGSGGSAVLQVAGSLTQSGTIDLSGGTGGVFETTAPNGRVGRSTGGTGAPGYVRYENDSAMVADLGNVVGPTVSAQNVGALSGSDAKSVAISTWYPFDADVAPNLRSYRLVATLNGVQQTFTDDPSSPNPVNVPGSPIQLKLQGATLDGANMPIGAPGPFVDTVDSLEGSAPTGFRFVLVIDTAVEADVVIDEFAITYDG